ncbi:MAG: polysaccharide biosynthesis protein [Flavobacteriales bacterium]|nr:polysaccharide biosynthesis protein [Flavobacteriales bacterium]
MSLQNNLLKKLASETAIYGITHTMGRLINFLLVPLYTGFFTEAEYGNLSVYYAAVSFVIVVLMYGMETAFFNFSRDENPEKVFATGQISLLVSTAFFVLLGLTFQHQIARFLEYPQQTNFVIIFVFILALDTLSNLPLAWLRYKKMPVKFGVVRLVNIGVNVGFNLLFLVAIPWLIKKGYNFTWYNHDFGIGYIIVSNLLASLVSFLMLLPYWKPMKMGFDKELWHKLWIYGRPLILIGLAGIVNETIDRLLLKKMLANDISDYEVGVYSAFYKLAMFMTIFVQSFKFAAEPFFFEQSKNENPQRIYAKVMHYFVLAMCFLLLLTLVTLPQIGPIFIRRKGYFEHQYSAYLTPILLYANLFLGIMYNLNIWYKLNNKMRIGSYISVGGAVGTIVLNVVLIPVIGILGSAIATLLVYFGMMVWSYTLGQKHYPIPYNLKINGFYIILATALYFIFLGLSSISNVPQIIWSILCLGSFIVLTYLIERPTKNRKFAT